MQRVQIQGTGGQHSGWFIMLDIWEVSWECFPQEIVFIVGAVSWLLKGRLNWQDGTRGPLVRLHLEFCAQGWE